MDVFDQVFVEQEYSCLDDMPQVNLVIDCGAYVGYSSAYFLTQFPTCYVIAVEPDASNFSMLKMNLAPYKERVRMVHSAIWSHPTGLVISERKFRDGREWSRQVRECEGNETPALTAVDISTLLKESGQDRISILKMDIEGAEAAVFSSNYEAWIDRVDVIAIELHDDSQFGKSSDILYAVCNSRFQFSRAGEVTVCKRRI